MEELVTPQPAAPVAPDLVLNELAKIKLKSIVKWSKILSVSGYVTLGVILLFFLFIGQFMKKAAYLSGQEEIATFNSLFYTLYGIVLIVIYFFPLFYLHRFSKKANIALQSEDSDMLTAALGEQDSFFKICGCYMIIALVLTAISILGFTLVLLFVS
ncbi:MAG: hypothetical protein QM654_09150 [Dysgonamonadaceae bacterium]